MKTQKYKKKQIKKDWRKPELIVLNKSKTYNGSYAGIQENSAYDPSR